MDLRHYFRKMREIEATIQEPHALISSLETSDGGKTGILTEVPRELAAKIIAEGRAVLATNTERELYLIQQEADRIAAQEAEMARRLHVTVVSEGDRSRVVQSSTGANLVVKKK